MGAFYYLGEAYDNGWLTQDDIKDIAYYYMGEVWIASGGKIEHTPRPKTPEVLSEKTRNILITAYYEFYPNKIFDADYWKNHTIEYFGTYSGCVVVLMEHGWTDTIGHEIIGDIEFYHCSMICEILVYR